MSLPKSPTNDMDIIAHIGNGSCADLYKIRCKTTKRIFACKMLRVNPPSDAELQLDTEFETLTTRLPRHENILNVYHHIEGYEESNASERSCLIMEFCSHGDLFDRIVDNEKLSESVAQRYMRHLLKAVATMHDSNVAHRDLKPENLLLDSNDVLKVCDFGLARPIFHDPETRKRPYRCTSAAGTLAYLAPEAVKKDARDLRAVDMWACGNILFFMLTGQLAFRRDRVESNDVVRNRILNCKLAHDPVEVHEALSKDAVDLIMRMLAYNPARRITAEQALEHPWVCTGDEDGAAPLPLKRIMSSSLAGTLPITPSASVRTSRVSSSVASIVAQQHSESSSPYDKRINSRNIDSGSGLESQDGKRSQYLPSPPPPVQVHSVCSGDGTSLITLVSPTNGNSDSGCATPRQSSPRSFSISPQAASGTPHFLMPPSSGRNQQLCGGANNGDSVSNNSSLTSSPPQSTMTSVHHTPRKSISERLRLPGSTPGGSQSATVMPTTPGTARASWTPRHPRVRSVTPPSTNNTRPSSAHDKKRVEDSSSN